VRAGIVTCADDYGWSSAQAYVGRRATPAFLTTTAILGQFGSNAVHAESAYRTFLRRAAESMSRSPRQCAVAGTLLGPSTWVRTIRDRIATRLVTLDAEEVPAANRLRLRPALDDVIDAVGAETMLPRSAITARHARGSPRALAIYLAHDLSGATHREIGVAFGVGRFAVSKAVGLVCRRLKTDRVLAEMLARVRARLRRNCQ